MPKFVEGGAAKLKVPNGKRDIHSLRCLTRTDAGQ